ncbi:MAG: CZB domain-containing protein [Janthinobacterium lividum]
MTADDIKRDFESALIKHLSFKAKLRSFLYGNGNEQGPLRDPDQCGLGQWIAERLHGSYQHLPEMPELDHQHRLIHQQANRLMDLQLAGQADAARAGFEQVQQVADHIVTLLQTMEQKLRTAEA